EPTSYGPGSASGAPSGGSAVAIISGVMPGGCASLEAANRTAATLPNRIDVLRMARAPRLRWTPPSSCSGAASGKGRYNPQDAARSCEMTRVILLVLAFAGAAAAQQASENTAVATFAGGCFWCVEEAFDKVEGVLSTTSRSEERRVGMECT